MGAAQTGGRGAFRRGGLSRYGFVEGNSEEENEREEMTGVGKFVEESVRELKKEAGVGAICEEASQSMGFSGKKKLIVKKEEQEDNTKMEIIVNV